MPRRDATVVTRLLEAGATITGKSMCEDLCFSGASFTSKPWPVRNPWDPSRNAGGSSSGSAVLVVTGEVDLALGGDQGGSVRIPSSFSGGVGHKPTHGLVPYTGAFPIEQTIDHLGPMTRTVADAALMLGVLAGVDGLDPRQPTSIAPVDYTAALAGGAEGLRIGVVTEGFGRPESDAGVDESVRAAIDALRGAGASVDEVSIPWHLDGMAVWNVIATEGAAFQMIAGNAYGMNSQGLYDPELIEHYAAQRITRGSELSKTVKLVGLSGALHVQGRRRQVVRDGPQPRVRAASGLRRGVLVVRRAGHADAAVHGPSAARLRRPARRLPHDGAVDDRQLRAVRRHRPPGVHRAGRAGGRAAVRADARRQAASTTRRCCAVAHAYEQAVGGFPAPPALTTVGGQA